MKKILIAALFSLFFCQVSSGKSYHLSLEESIELAKEKSYLMQRLLQNLDISTYNLKATTSQLRTHIDLDLTLPDYSEVMREYADRPGQYFPLQLLHNSASLRIRQPLPTDGNIYIQSGLISNTNYDDKSHSANVNTRIGLTQPLHSIYGYNSVKSALKLARLEFERASKAYKREELNLVYNISQYFYNLLSLQKSAEIAQLNLDRQQEAYEISKNKYEAGLIREVEALQMEVDLAEAQSQCDMAVLSQSSSLNSFKEALGIELNDDITLKSELLYSPVAVDTEQAVQLALKNRLEIRESEIAIERQELALKEQKSVGLPKTNITAYFEKTGVGGTHMDLNGNLLGSVNNSLNDFTDRRPNFGVGFTVSIPILDWGENRARIRAAETMLKQRRIEKVEEERSIETEVRNLASGISINLKRLQLLEKNLSVAEKSFEITLKRFSDGDIDSQALALERQRLNTAYTSHLNAYITYQLSLADIMRKTFYDFSTGRPLVD